MFNLAGAAALIPSDQVSCRQTVQPIEEVFDVRPEGVANIDGEHEHEAMPLLAFDELPYRVNPRSLAGPPHDESQSSVEVEVVEIIGKPCPLSRLCVAQLRLNSQLVDSVHDDFADVS